LVRILLLGPDRWPAATQDPHAGLKIRREIVKESSDLDAEWILMEDDPTPGDATQKFLALAVHPSTTHVFLIWPRNAKMVGTSGKRSLSSRGRHLSVISSTSEGCSGSTDGAGRMRS
jgi:hypothetical protein